MDEKRGNHDIELDRVTQAHYKTGTKLGVGQASMANSGAVFGFLSIAVILISVFTGGWHLFNYLSGYGWARNSTKLRMELDEPFVYTTASHTCVTVHALLGVFVLFLSLYQSTTGTLLSLQEDKNKEGIMRKSHRSVGWVGGTVLLTVYVTGAVSLFRSTHLSAARAEKSFWPKLAHDGGFMILGAGCIVNLILALKAVCGPKDSRDYIMHKGCMCFSFLWILGTALPELSINLMQFFVHDCVIDGSATVYVASVTQPIQFVAIAYCCYRWGGSAVDRPFVKVNMALLFLLIVITLVSLTYTLVNPIGDGYCLSNGIF